MGLKPDPCAEAHSGMGVGLSCWFHHQASVSLLTCLGSKPATHATREGGVLVLVQGPRDQGRWGQMRKVPCRKAR
jgi:hypothetical protein